MFVTNWDEVFVQFVLQKRKSNENIMENKKKIKTKVKVVDNSRICNVFGGARYIERNDLSLTNQFICFFFFVSSSWALYISFSPISLQAFQKFIFLSP